MSLQYRPISADSHPRIVGPGTPVLDASADIASHAAQHLRIDAFRLTDKPTLDVFAQTAQRGVAVDMLFDPDSVPKVRVKELEAAGVHLIPYGHEPYKQHSKAIDADGVQGMVATDVSDSVTRDRIDTGVRFDGPAATALNRLLQLDGDTPHQDVSSAVADAAKAGILVNDPHLDVRKLTEGLHQLVDGATQTLVVGTKVFTDKGMGRRIADAARRGVKTTVISQEFKPEVRKMLEDAGASVRVQPLKRAIMTRTGLHGTLIAADDLGVVTSAFLAGRAIDGSDKRQSRELGAIVSGQGAADIAAAIQRAYDAAGQGARHATS